MAYVADLTDSGSDDLWGGATLPVGYLVARVDSTGPLVLTRYTLTPTILTGAGWVRFGDTLDLGDGAADYWNEPIWINEFRFQWSAPRDGGLSAGRISWYVSPGTSIHVLVDS